MGRPMPAEEEIPMPPVPHAASRRVPSGRTVRRPPSQELEKAPMARCRPLLGCLVAALLVAFAAPNASAEDEYTDAKLHSFASAVLAVNAIVERWRDRKSTRLNSSHVRISY